MNTRSLTVYRHETLPPLAAALADMLAGTTPVNPLAGIRIAVPSFAVARWLTEQLARHPDGEYAHVANVRTCFPGGLIDEILDSVLQDDADGAYRPDRLRWTVLHLLRDQQHLPTYATIRAQLGDSDTAPHGVTFARHAADLFDRYIRHRPELLDRWEAGDDVDSHQQPLPAHLAWQPALWRSIKHTVAEHPPHRRIAAATDRLAGGTQPDGLADQYLLLGVHGIATNELQLFNMLAAHRPVSLFLLTASRSFAFDADPAPKNRFLDVFSVAAQTQHRQVVAAGLDATVTDCDQPIPANPDDPTALHLLQQQLATDMPVPPADRRVRLEPADPSIRMHACHGIVREIDAVKDQLLRLLDDDDTLQPHDIAILTPDIDTFAPLIAGVLADGDHAGDSARQQPRMPFAIRDRSVAKTNPVADVLAQLFALAQSRVTLSTVAELISHPLILEQLELTGEDVTDVVALLTRAGVRFGIDGNHRATLGASGDAAGSFQHGFDRILTGMTIDNPGDQLLYDVAPHTPPDTATTQHFLTVYGFLTDLFHTITRWQTPRSLDAWLAATSELLDTLLPAPPTNYDRQADTDTVHRIAHELADQADGHTGLHLTLRDYTTVFTRALQRHGVAGVNDTGITVSSLLGVRSIPFRVVCLVGLNDPVLAKAPEDVVHDLVATQPQQHESTARDETRQLVYDAIINATDTLIITHTAYDPARGDTLPRARILDDIIELIDATFVCDDGLASTRLTVTHPRQLTHPTYYTAGSPQLRSDRFGVLLARAAHTPPPGDVVDLTRFHSTPVDGNEPVTLNAITTALTNASQAFLRRHGITVVKDADETVDRDPFVLRGLDAYQVYDELLAWPEPASLTRVVDTLPYRGTLPNGSFGTLAFADVATFADDLASIRRGTRSTVTVSLTLDTAVVTGEILTFDRDVVMLTASTNPAKTLLDAWVELLALTVHDGEARAGMVWFRDGATLKNLRLVAPGVDDAYTLLTDLDDIRRQVVTQPTPLFARTSYAYATQVAKGETHDKALARAANDWSSQTGFGDSSDTAVRYLYGYDVPLEQIADDDRFGLVATRLFLPLIDAHDTATA